MASEIKVDTISEKTSANGVSIDSVTLKDSKVTANGGLVADNITIDGTEIDLSSGDLTVDVAGDITFMLLVIKIMVAEALMKVGLTVIQLTQDYLIILMQEIKWLQQENIHFFPKDRVMVTRMS